MLNVDLEALHFMGKDPTLKLMHDYCHKHGANVAFTFEDLLTVFVILRRLLTCLS